jgi:hypothetical protein
MNNYKLKTEDSSLKLSQVKKLSWADTLLANWSSCLIYFNSSIFLWWHDDYSHPAMMDQRQLLKRDIELHFLCLKYTALPPAQKWILLLMHHAEVHLWEDSEMAGYIWNGRWSRETIRHILNEHADTLIPPSDYVSAIHWLSNLTLLQLKSQTALYSSRRQILRQMDLLPRPNNITLRRPSPWPCGPRTQTLFSAWNIRYSRGIHPPKRPPRYLFPRK